jgi:hypothetical protein
MFIRGESGKRRVLELATAVNISAGGTLIAAKRSFPVSSWVDIEIPHGPIGDHALLEKAVTSMRAQVLRCTPVARAYLLAFKFEKPLGHLQQPSSKKT